jgi:PAS domain S-box-containing protein
MIQIREPVAVNVNDIDRLTLALDAAKMGWWDLDLITNKMIWNPYHELIFGYEPGTPERNYFDWEHRVHPEDLEWIHQAIHRARDFHEDLEIQYRIVWPDDSLHWVNALGRFHYDAEGHPVRMLGIVTDITDHKQAEQALQESEERFRATFEQAAVGIAHVGLDGRWLRINQKLHEIVGYTSEEISEKTFQDITHPEDLETDLEYVNQLLAGKIHTYSMEKRYIHKEGFSVWAKLTVSLVRQAEAEQEHPKLALGAPKYFIAVIEDISERKRIEAERIQAQLELQERARELAEVNLLLEQRNQELDQFVHVVSHDLKAPLRAIANLSEWIETDLEGQLPPDNQHQLQLIRTRVQRMGAMIDGLLEFSRVGRTQVALETIAVMDLLTEVIDSLDPLPPFTVQVEPPMPILRTKPLLLGQVFANLIGNAIKHHDRPDGYVRISMQEQPEYYEFAVSDNGPGIAPEDHDKIFTIFQTIKTCEAQESTGIGLSIVKKIIETEGGSIHLESEIGKGATFRFTWPK